MRLFDTLQDFLDSFHTWNEYRKLIGEDQDSWTYSQGCQDTEYYQTMLAYWNALNGK